MRFLGQEHTREATKAVFFSSTFCRLLLGSSFAEFPPAWSAQNLLCTIKVQGWTSRAPLANIAQHQQQRRKASAKPTVVQRASCDERLFFRFWPTKCCAFSAATLVAHCENSWYCPTRSVEGLRLQWTCGASSWRANNSKFLRIEWFRLCVCVCVCVCVSVCVCVATRFILAKYSQLFS